MGVINGTGVNGKARDALEAMGKRNKEVLPFQILSLNLLSLPRVAQDSLIVSGPFTGGCPKRTRMN